MVRVYKTGKGFIIPTMQDQWELLVKTMAIYIGYGKFLGKKIVFMPYHKNNEYINHELERFFKREELRDNMCYTETDLLNFMDRFPFLQIKVVNE